jgi:hypothetical protein
MMAKVVSVPKERVTKLCWRNRGELGFTIRAFHLQERNLWCQWNGKCRGLKFSWWRRKKTCPCRKLNLICPACNLLLAAHESEFCESQEEEYNIQQQPWIILISQLVLGDMLAWNSSERPSWYASSLKRVIGWTGSTHTDHSGRAM